MKNHGTKRTAGASIPTTVQGCLRLLNLKAALLAWLFAFCPAVPADRHSLTGQSNEEAPRARAARPGQSFTLASLGAYVPLLTVLRPGPLRLPDMKILLQVDPGDDSEFLDWLEATEPDDPESALDFPELRK